MTAPPTVGNRTTTSRGGTDERGDHRQRFHEVDWRIVRDDACAHFRTGSFTAGVSLVDAIGRLADAANHHPDVDLRPDGVTVRLRTHSTGGLSERDVDLARQISAVARDLGVPIDPPACRSSRSRSTRSSSPTCCRSGAPCSATGRRTTTDLIDPHSQGPPFWFQQMDAPRPQRNRIHIDVYVPHDQAEARVAAAIAAGGHLVSDENAPEWWTLADAEGNEVDVAPWPDRN